MAAASSYPPTPDVLYASITALMPIRLDSTNLSIWKHLITCIFRAHNLLGYIDGSLQPPQKHLQNDAASVNPLYQLWEQRDAAVMTVIHATLAPSALPLIVGCDTSRELWLKLEDRCSDLTDFHITKLRTDLERATKGADSVHAYVVRIEEMRDLLRGYEVVIEDKEMMVFALRGLPTEYNAFRASMAARAAEPEPEPLTLDGFYVKLLEEEAALRAKNQYNFPNFADGQWSSNQCQICNEAGHVALVCPHRMDFTYQGRND